MTRKTPKEEIPSKKPKKVAKNKLIVLDTNVLMHDPAAFMCFGEHDIWVSPILIEELNNHKGDRDRTIGFASRETFRLLEALLDLAGPDKDPKSGIPLELLSTVAVSHAKNFVTPTGMLFCQNFATGKSPEPFTHETPDNEFLSIALQLKERGENVVLVSNDRAVRVKAKFLGIRAEDYRNDRAIDDIDVLYSGIENLPANFWETVDPESLHSWKHGEFTYWDIKTPLAQKWRANQFLYLTGPDGEESEYTVLHAEKDGAQIRTIRDFRKHEVFGIFARTREQNFALNALMDPDIDFVSLAGKAGSGKTLLAVAAGLEQIIERKKYNKMIFTREAAPLGKDQGFLPGNEESKLGPWLGALYDNLEILTEKDEKSKGDPATDEAMKKGKIGNPILEKAISIKSLNYMQGRTLVRKFFVVDETQNITRAQAKQLITRAGPGTKVIFLGNLAQVADPYLTGTSSGLAYVAERFKTYKSGAHVTLIGVERSRLAEFAAENL